MDPIINEMNNPNNALPVKKHNGMTVLIVIVIILLAAILIINTKQNKEEMALDQEIAQKQAEIKANDEQVKQIQIQGTNDDVGSIEADLNATNVDAITLD